MVLTLFVILTVAFMVVRLMPGNVYNDPELPENVIEALRKNAHLDEPLIVQYGYFLQDVILRNDWGTSVKVSPSVPAFDVLKTRIPASLKVNLIALLIAIPLGIIFGTIAAFRRDKAADNVISFFVVIFISIPSFVFASLLQYTLGFKLGLFPILYSATGSFNTQLHSLILPVLALAFGPIATITRYLRGELIETLGSEFMLLARTKGLTHIQATMRHAFRNSCVPIISVIIPMFATILGGSLVVEQIFAIPGVGNVMINSINANDYSLSVAVLMFYSLATLITILVVDIAYGIIDPRIRMGGKAQ
jgi:ABC-type dipeptide/oligopeptide/nickel transport systems, permease components